MDHHFAVGRDSPGTGSRVSETCNKAAGGRPKRAKQHRVGAVQGPVARMLDTPLSAAIAPEADEGEKA